MKVLYCESGSGRGGSATSLFEFLKACGGSAIEPSVLCSTEEARALFERTGYPVHMLPEGSGAGGVALGLWRIIRSVRPEVVHTNNDIYSHIGTIVGSRARRIPVVAHHRAVRPLTRAERILWKRVRHHVAVSGWVRDSLVSQGMASDSVSVVYDAIEMPAAKSLDPAFARRSLGLKPEARLVGTVGSLRPEKGLDVLVDAAGRLKDRSEIHFLLVGGDYHRAAGYGEQLRRRVSDFGLDGRFHFTGHVTDPLRWIGSMNLLVFPTLLPEGFGRASLEGMACGVPVVASNLGAVPEVVEEGVTGYLVAPGDAGLLERKIRQTLSGDQSAVVERALKKAATKFSLGVQVAGMLGVYQRVLGRPPGVLHPRGLGELP